ncbi:uncharacterized protein LOC126835748 isoform X1 [Adelges cooleyi]|uniref:uncharacterized protein LOC126835748 isoform X1 n=1 Tax=Adelges cooleyi TaxID=133065 RepID=UPI00217F7725|nr:uncharacterized protein LOC126835748 isoform X1 [Adelges cooleyi]
MKLFCVLMSLAFMHVMADISKAYYAEVVVNTNNIIQKASSVTNVVRGNVLEYVILVAVRSTNLNIETLNNMFTLPELEHFESYTQKFINDQIAIHTVLANLLRELSVLLPETSNGDFENMDLKTLRKNRRGYTRKALTNIIIRLQIGKEPDITHGEACCLIGLVISTKFPNSPTTITNDEKEHTCSLTNTAGIVTMYRSFGGMFYKVKADSITVPGEPLISQL